MNRRLASITAAAVLGTAWLTVLHHVASAQPAKGAPAAFERVREVMTSRFKNMKLTGDPDRDFAALLMAHHEELIYLAKTQLEYGGDRQLRQTAQKLLDETQKEIDGLKQWEVRMRQPDYRAQPDQPAPGSGPLDRKESAQAAPAAPTTSQATPAQAAPTPDLPLVSGTVEKVDTAGGKITLEHGAIPNLNMDSMTMVFRAQDPAMLKGLKARDKVRFTADRVNGQITVTKIQKAR
jgi:Cu/Ag efflux protein CusF